eukprot:6764182-Pyramimonas_sp.AAC.1
MPSRAGARPLAHAPCILWDLGYHPGILFLAVRCGHGYSAKPPAASTPPISLRPRSPVPLRGQ